MLKQACGQEGRKNPVTIRDRGKEKVVAKISKPQKGSS